MVAKRTEPKSDVPDGYTLVVSPFGAESTVPDAIRDALVESGYTVK